MFDSTVLDDVKQTCSVARPGLNDKKRNSGRKEKKVYTSRPPHSVSLQYHQSPSSRLFFKDMMMMICDVLPFACTVNHLFVLYLAPEKTRQMDKINS